MELIKEIPIFFDTLMVRAIYNGKTQTRRVVEPQFEIASYGKPPCNYDIIDIPIINGHIWATATNSDSAGGFAVPVYCNKKGKPIKALYQKGNLMWVRETYHVKGGLPAIEKLLETNFKDKKDCLIYKADLPESDWKNYKWSPPIFMRKNACRLWLKVIDVRVERLQDIVVGDIKREGCPEKIFFNSKMSNVAKWFTLLWDSINKKPEYSWKANPWVWVIEFERV